jgi:two-component sensor histidine kinase
VQQLAEIAAQTDLLPDDVEHLVRLTAEWSLLSDLSFSDLVLWLPTWNQTGYLAAAQQRPTTGPTVFTDDVIGSFLPRGRRPFLDRALDQRTVAVGPTGHALVPAEAIPVVRGGAAIAVIARHRDPGASRTTGRLETAYLDAFADLSAMVVAGEFPAGPGSAGLSDPPRAGDGLIRLDAEGSVAFASPNALSAYRRLGLAADLVGSSLADVSAALLVGRGPADEDLAVVASGRAAAVAEVAVRRTTVLLRSIPLRRGGQPTGALVCVRDVSEVRRREQELLSKDATIREIHHRVKNNLQTVASLLRLQSRRVDEPQARAALDEAVRRVGSIALVHETLAGGSGETVEFDDVADRLVAMSRDLAGERQSEVQRRGGFGRLPDEVATPLSLVLNELLQNAVEHGGGSPVILTADRAAGSVRMEVCDRGPGLPPGFDPDHSERLGLRIVRTLVVSDLGGSLEFATGPGGGLCVAVEVPLVG